MAIPDQQQPQPLIRGWWAAVSLLSVSAALFVLTFADRAPRYTIDRAPELTELGRRVEARTGVDLIDRNDVPLAIDDLGHFVLWVLVGVAAFVVLDARRWPRLVGGHRIRARAVLALLLILAMSFELGQAVLTSTRELSISDGIANLVGAVTGMALAWVGVRLWRHRRRLPA